MLLMYGHVLQENRRQLALSSTKSKFPQVGQNNSIILFYCLFYVGKHNIQFQNVEVKTRTTNIIYFKQCGVVLLAANAKILLKSCHWDGSTSQTHQYVPNCQLQS